MDLLFTPALYFVFALIQSVVFLLLIRFLDLYEREPLSILALMAVWGATGAVILSLLGNTLIGLLVSLLSPATEVVFGAAISAPLVEETAKGMVLVVVFALSYLTARRFGGLEFSGVTDGIVYGAAVGLGFSFAEDIHYFLNYAAEGGIGQGLDVYLRRVDLFGTGQLGHAVYTGTFGVGLGLATWSRNWISRIVFPFLGLGLAMFMHAVHNGLIPLVLVLRFGLENTAAAFSGESLPAELIQQMESTFAVASVAVTVADYLFAATFFLVIGLWLLYQRRVIRNELAEEVDTGLISREEWEIMPRYWRRSKWYWQVLWSGKLEQWRVLRRVHNELVDLAFLKWRLRRMGGDWGRVERLRRRIRNLKSQEIVE
jgi:RsiW-degrading membrane proteinase PrsW (M82 family)